MAALALAAAVPMASLRLQTSLKSNVSQEFGLTSSRECMPPPQVTLQTPSSASIIDMADDAYGAGVVRMSIKPVRTPKRWEKPPQKANGMPIRHKLHVKIGDTVQLISGHDKGKVSEIAEIDYIRQMVLCKDINLKTKHKKPRAKGESGQIVQEEAPIHSSQVMHYSTEQKVASRVGHKILDDGSKVRYLIKTGEVIDKPGDWEKRHPKTKEPIA